MVFRVDGRRVVIVCVGHSVWFRTGKSEKAHYEKYTTVARGLGAR